MSGATGVLAGAAIAGAGVSAYGISQQKKAADQAAEAAKNAGVNIPQVSQLAQDQALRNIQLSHQVEQQYAPQNAAYRNSSLAALQGALGGLGNNDAIQSYINRVGSVSPVDANLVGHQANSSLLSDAVAKAQSDLALGGNLPQDVKNQIARSAAANGGRAGAASLSGLGRDITLRDLGLNSLSLQQQRLQNAAQLGQADLGANQFNASALSQADQGNLAARQFNAQLGLQAGNQNLSIAQLLAGLKTNDFTQLLGAAQFGQGIQQPVVGLDPSAIANLAVGNSNQQASANQNAAAIRGNAAGGMTQLGGQLIGLGMMGLNAYGNSAGSTPYTTFQSPAPGTVQALPQYQNLFK